MSNSNVAIGDNVSLELAYRDDGIGVVGMSCQVALRDTTNGKYLDFNDNIWKSSGWMQRLQNLVDIGNGRYQYLWNSFSSVKEPMIILAEYEVLTTGYAATSEDLFIFGIAEVVESGRWKILNNQMIFYARDGVTPLLTFNLFDGIGVPTEINVKERVLA